MAPNPLHIVSFGQGEPVIFLHGFTLDHEMWLPQMQALSGSFKVVGIDLPGHGRSSGPTPDCLQEASQLVQRAINDCVGQQNYHLCGLSLGGYYALELARLHPSRVSSLALLNAEARPDSLTEQDKRDHFIQSLTKKGPKDFVYQVSSRLLSPACSQPELLPMIRQKMLATPNASLQAGLRQMRDRPDYRHGLAAHSFRKLFIRGEDDQMFANNDFEELQRLCPDADVAVVPGAGHLVNLEQPQLTTEILKTFLR